MENENYKELCGENRINIQSALTLRKQNNKGEKQSETLPNYFLGILWKMEGVNRYVFVT